MKYNQRKIGAILSYATIFVNTLVQLIYTPFLIKMLGQSEYGLYSLVSSIIGYLTILDLGFGNALIIYTAKYHASNDQESEKKLHGMFKIIYMGISILTILIMGIVILNVNKIFGFSMSTNEIYKLRVMMIVLSFNLAITFAFSIYTSILSAYEKFIFQKILSLVNIFLKLIIMIPLLFMGYKSIAMTLVLTLVNVIVLISNYLFCVFKLKIKPKFIGFDKNIFKIIIGYSFWVFLGTVVDKINWSVDHFILGIYCGTTAVAMYNVAAQLNLLFTNLSTAMSGVLLPKVSKMIANGASDNELSDEFIKIGRIQYYVIFLAASGYVIFGKTFFNLWVGKSFSDSYYIGLLLILPVCIPLIQNIGISILQAKNKYKFRSIVYFLVAIFNVLISIPLAKHYGGIGSALGTAISLIIGNIIIINIYYNKIGIKISLFWKNIFKMSFFFIIPIVIILILIKFIILSGLSYILVFGSIYTLMYIAICYLFVMNEYEKDLILTAVKKLKRSK